MCYTIEVKEKIAYGTLAALIIGGVSYMSLMPSKTLPSDDYAVERSFAETGDMDCGDFGDQFEAQEFFESEGGPDVDWHNLDRDGDGYVCETLAE